MGLLKNNKHKKEEKYINMRYFDCTRTFKLSFFNYLVATDYNVCQIQIFMRPLFWKKKNYICDLKNVLRLNF